MKVALLCQSPRSLVLFALFWGFILTTSPLTAASVAQITELSGQVTVIRNGNPLPDNLQPGTGLEDFDLVRTGPQSHVSLIFPSTGGFTGTLHIGPNTVLWWQLSPQWDQKARIYLITGSLEVHSESSQPTSVLDVQTARLLLKSTQAKFWLATAGDENLLAVSLDGLITGTYRDLTLFSQPGSGLELQGRNFQTISVDPSTLKDYLKTWQQGDQQAQKQSASSFPELARQYLLELGQLTRAEDRLSREGSVILNLWKSQEVSGTISTLEAAEHEKSLVVGPLLQVQSPLLSTLSLNQSLNLAWQAAQKGNLPDNTEVSAGYTAQDFFQRWKQDQTLLTRWTEEFCWDNKLFAERNQGKGLPQESKSAESINETDFFN